MELTDLYKEETNGRPYRIKQNRFSEKRIYAIKYVKWLEEKVSQLEKQVILRGAENNMNELEFKTAYKESELGMIKGWEHIIAICNACIKSHKEDLTDEHINQVWNFNKHKYESTESK